MKSYKKIIFEAGCPAIGAMLLIDEMLTQCHRAFLVNLNYVESLHSTSTSAYVLRLFGVDKVIPVSRTFLPMVKAKLHPARECDL